MAGHDERRPPAATGGLPASRSILAPRRLRRDLVLGLLLAIGYALIPVPVWPRVAPGSVELALLVLLAALLVWASVIDIREQRLPDGLNAAVLLGGLAHSGLSGAGAVMWSIASAAAGFAALSLVALAYRRLRQRDGLGGGDAKLLGASAAWTGLEALASIVFLAAASALVFVMLAAFARRRLEPDRPLSFGPFLGAAAWAVLWWGPLDALLLAA